jgi:C_GCAxxG_C_C family probable redox protein
MNRFEKAFALHEKGYNCAQAVIGAYADVIGIGEQEAYSIGAGFGGGAGTGELCGAVSGAVMVLGLLTPVDLNDPAGSKKRTTALSKEFQKRFVEKFRHLRCHDLLRDPTQASDATPAAQAMGVTNHCRLMVVTAVEIVEDMLMEHQ